MSFLRLFKIALMLICFSVIVVGAAVLSIVYSHVKDTPDLNPGSLRPALLLQAWRLALRNATKIIDYGVYIANRLLSNPFDSMEKQDIKGKIILKLPVSPLS